MTADARRPVIGILGGMGPLATSHFYARLTVQSPAILDQDHFRVVVDSDPGIPDRTAFLLGQGEDPRPAIVAAANRLAACGADLLVIPCNSANIFRKDVERHAALPVVDWIGDAVAEVVRREFRVIGILGSTGTIRAGEYQRRLASHGVGSIVPDADSQDVLMSTIYAPEGVKGRHNRAWTRPRLLSVGETLVQRGADALLLACTELPLAVPADDRAWIVPVVDPGEVAVGALCRSLYLIGYRYGVR